MGRTSAWKRKKKDKRKNDLSPGKQLVKRANRMKNPLDIISPEQCMYAGNDLNLRVTYSHISNLDTEILDWAFQLTKLNMKTLYENCEWGWDDKEKFSQLKHRTSRFLIAVNEENEPKAFVNFRFDTDYDDPVMYCYEIQLESVMQRKGVGKYLMDLLYQIAKMADMKKVVLTVLKSNASAFRFYVDACNFKIDPSSPSVSKENECYEILSKMCRYD